MVVYLSPSHTLGFPLSTSQLRTHDPSCPKFLGPNTRLCHRNWKSNHFVLEGILKVRNLPSKCSLTHQAVHFLVSNLCAWFHSYEDIQEHMQFKQQRTSQFPLGISCLHTDDHRGYHLWCILRRSKFCTHFRTHSPLTIQRDDLTRTVFPFHS